MTSTQILTILTIKNIPINTWMPIEDKIKIIPMTHDDKIYTCDNSNRYRFNQTQGLIEMVHGYVRSDGIFVSDAGETENYTPTNYFDYSTIYAIVCNAQKSVIGDYKKIDFPIPYLGYYPNKK